MAIAGRIFDRLVAQCGADTIFMDIEAIPFGKNFRTHIDEVLKDCNLLIALIGPQWLGSREGEPPRISDKADPVRVEIQTALRRGITVVPVLVEGAQMPKENDLPRGLRQFASLNALDINSGRDFNFHVERLIGVVQEIVGSHAEFSGVRQPSAGSSNRTAAGVGAASETSQALRLFIAYLLVLAPLLVLAHYLIIIRFDLSPLFLRIAAFALPAATGFATFWRSSESWGIAFIFAISVALLAVFLMLTLVNLVDGSPIIPSTVWDWQEAFEYFVTIVLGALAGNAMADFYRRRQS